MGDGEPHGHRGEPAEEPALAGGLGVRDGLTVVAQAAPHRSRCSCSNDFSRAAVVNPRPQGRPPVGVRVPRIQHEYHPGPPQQTSDAAHSLGVPGANAQLTIDPAMTCRTPRVPHATKATARMTASSLPSTACPDWNGMVTITEGAGLRAPVRHPAQTGTHEPPQPLFPRQPEV